jgi:hypothetical protein
MRRAGARALAALALAGLAGSSCYDFPSVLAPDLRHVALLPLAEESVRFAVIGDSGSGNERQYELSRRMTEARESFPFEFVLMLGDNLYGREREIDYQRKFELPYAALLEQGVEFYAALGNHDDTNQRFYEPFNMGGERYYRFEKGPAEFFALDSNYMDEEQLAWLRSALSDSDADWKIAFMHHPPYSSGAFHGSETDLRELLEPLFIEYGVRVVFAGHEHFYERIQPQREVYYFISGSASRLRPGNIRGGTSLTASGFDADLSFMLVEIAGDRLHFETISRTGKLVDSGAIHELEREEPVEARDRNTPGAKPLPAAGEPPITPPGSPAAPE